MKICETIDKWKNKLDIPHWIITTERIDPEQVMYNGETYFIGISIDWNNLSGVIYHDIDLYEEAIVHELLHVRYSTENEDWVVNKTNELLKPKEDE
jgi:hypothetical protein